MSDPNAPKMSLMNKIATGAIGVIVVAVVLVAIVESYSDSESKSDAVPRSTEATSDELDYSKMSYGDLEEEDDDTRDEAYGQWVQVRDCDLPCQAFTEKALEAMVDGGSLATSDNMFEVYDRAREVGEKVKLGQDEIAAEVASDEAAAEKLAAARRAAGRKAAAARKAAASRITISADELLVAFDQNELAADRRFTGKTLTVSGVVEKVDTDVLDDEVYLLYLIGSGEYSYNSVSCRDLPEDVLAGLSVGQSMTVVGKFDDGGDLGVELSGCRVA